MEKVLAFFISGFLVSGLSGGGVTYKPTLKSPKSLAFFKTLFFGVRS
ncbi:hypothetical protein HPHPP11B_0986 [Helicobacter pylori Hp P-11b]|uniref:Uncharacterized protein n=1 Tax=Helicobacter pylori Hp P-11b TaxID=992106 RepID=I9YL19_HELPX|nr:hypothetical protein HPHPP11B_0986 [Helicobacter pylori Hp P-11b]